jgi:hypothetical protein
MWAARGNSIKGFVFSLLQCFYFCLPEQFQLGVWQAACDMEPWVESVVMAVAYVDGPGAVSE